MQAEEEKCVCYRNEKEKGKKFPSASFYGLKHRLTPISSFLPSSLLF